MQFMFVNKKTKGGRAKMSKGKLPKLSVREFDGGWGVFKKGNNEPLATGRETTLRNHARSVRQQEKES